MCKLQSFDKEGIKQPVFQSRSIMRIDHLQKSGYDQEKLKSIFHPVNQGGRLLFSFERSNTEIPTQEQILLQVLFDGLNSDNKDLILPLFGDF